MAMAIKVLYEMGGALPKAAVALVADLCVASGALAGMDVLGGQDCGLRERLLLELAELLEAALPNG